MSRADERALIVDRSLSRTLEAALGTRFAGVRTARTIAAAKLRRR